MWNKFINFFADMAEESEQRALEKRREQLAKFQKRQRILEKEQIPEALRKVAEIDKKRKERTKKEADSIHYQEFKTVLEMVYVEQKAHYAKERWTEGQKEAFDKKFSANLKKCMKNQKFKEEYDLYLEALERGGTSNPQTQREISRNRILEEVNNIYSACMPSKTGDSFHKRAIKLKYEKMLDDNKKEIELKRTISSSKKRIISI